MIQTDYYWKCRCLEYPTCQIKFPHHPIMPAIAKRQIWILFPEGKIVIQISCKILPDLHAVPAFVLIVINGHGNSQMKEYQKFQQCIILVLGMPKIFQICHGFFYTYYIRIPNCFCNRIFSIMILIKCLIRKSNFPKKR